MNKNERQKEIRRLVLNQEIANNERIKMGYSRRDWHKLKDFYKQYAAKLESLMATFTEKHPTLDDVEQVYLFEELNTKWYNFIKPLMNKLKPIPQSKKRVEILNRFTKAVDDWLASDKEEMQLAPAKASDDVLVPQGNLIDEILDLYRRFSNNVILRGYLREQFNDKPVAVIKFLRGEIGRGRKTLFEAQARELMDKHKSTSCL